MVTVAFVIVFISASFSVRKLFVPPHEEGLFGDPSARGSISLRKSWVVQQAISHQTLCKQLESFLPELFVAVPEVLAHHNLAERRVRPLVLARTISCGSRCPKRSKTRTDLASLFGT
jgi:hypothetical protein